MCHFRHLSWTKFCWYKPLLLLSSIYLPFSLCKILKKFLEQIQSYEHAPFLGPKWSICPTQLFFLEKINIIFIYLLTPFHCAKLKKKFLQWIHSYKDVPFLSPKWSICPNENFFRKPVNKSCSFLSCIPVCQKSRSEY